MLLTSHMTTFTLSLLLFCCLARAAADCTRSFSGSESDSQPDEWSLSGWFELSVLSERHSSSTCFFCFFFDLDDSRTDEAGRPVRSCSPLTNCSVFFWVNAFLRALYWSLRPILTADYRGEQGGFEFRVNFGFGSISIRQLCRHQSLTLSDRRKRPKEEKPISKRGKTVKVS